MTIGLCGDLKFGRTVHSLIHALVRYEGIRFVLISPEELRLPGYIRQDVLDKNHIEYKEVVRLEDAMPELDILYLSLIHILFDFKFFKREIIHVNNKFIVSIFNLGNHLVQILKLMLIYFDHAKPLIIILI